MNYKKLLFFTSFVFITIISINLYSQKDKVKFGQISPQELEMTIYEPDPDASAVVLHEHGFAYFVAAEGIKIEFEHHVKIKILKESGLNFANFEIPHERTDKVNDFDAATYNLENGKMVTYEINKENIFEEKTTTEMSTKICALSNVRVGSVIEYKYRVQYGSFYNFVPWNFQWPIPVKWSEFNAEIPTGIDYKINKSGYHPVVISDKKTENSTYTGLNGTSVYYRWAVKDLPVFREEPLIPCVTDFVNKIDFELVALNIPGAIYKDYNTDYIKFSKNLMQSEYFGLPLKRTGFIKDELGKAIAGKTDEKEKALAIYNFVSHNMHWNGDNSLYVNTNIKEAYTKKEGNSADINLLLVAMMQMADLKADPVALSTKDNGKLNPVFPTTNKFNYVIASVLIGNDRILLDATDTIRPYHILPERCLNGQGRLISETQFNWVDLNPVKPSQQSKNYMLSINENGMLHGQIQVSETEHLAQQSRENIIWQGKDNFENSQKKDNQFLNVKSFTIDNFDNNSKPLIYKYNVEIGDINKTKEMLYL